MPFVSSPHEAGPSKPLDTDLSWREIVECGPVPTLLVEGGTDTELVGRIVYCNAAARGRLHLLPLHESSTQSLCDLVDSEDCSIVRGLLSAPLADLRPIEVDIALSIEPGRQPRGKSRTARFALHLQSVADNRFVVQLVSSDGWSAAEEALAEQHRFHSALMELSDLAHATEDDDEFYQRLLERAIEVVPGAQGGSVQLGIDNTTGFRFVAAVGYDLDGLRAHVLDRSDFFRDAIDPRAQIVRQFDNHGRSAEIVDWLETVGRLSEIVVNVSAPVVVAGKPVAFLSLDNFEDPSAITQTSVEMTTVLSGLIGDLWLRRRLEAQLREEREAFRHQALHDALTGLANRRSLDAAVREHVADNRKIGAPSTVLFVDLDNFKEVNDRLGHDGGDELLIAVATGLRQVIDRSGLVGRWGGDEFLVVPTRVKTPTQAMELAADILRFFEDEVHIDDRRYQARLSVGVGWSEGSENSAVDLVTAGDRALYQAKADGKGTVGFRQC